MPIPFLLAGLGVAAGVIGAGGHLSAKETNEKDEEVSREAQKLYNDAKYSLDQAKGNTEQTLLVLASSKRDVLATSIPQFLDTFQKIKDIKLQLTNGIDEISKFSLDQEDVMELQNMVDIYFSSFLGGATGAATGALVALAATGSLSLVTGGLASAGGALLAGQVSTAAGLAGSTLSMGAAVTPLAAIAAPVILFTGISASMKADENLEKANVMHAKAEKASEEMKVSERICTAITERSNMFNELLVELNGMFAECSNLLTAVVRNKEKKLKKSKFTANDFTKEEHKLIYVTRSLAGAIKAVIDTPILSKDGNIACESEKVYENTQNELPKINTVYEEVKEYDYGVKAKQTQSSMNNDSKKKSFFPGGGWGIVIAASVVLIAIISIIGIGMYNKKSNNKVVGIRKNNNQEVEETQNTVKEGNEETVNMVSKDLNSQENITRIIKDTLNISELQPKEFDLEYSYGINETGNEGILLAMQDETGFIGSSVMDFDGDQAKEILVVSLDKTEGKQNYITLHMLESNGGNWKESDAIVKDSREYYGVSQSMECPQRVDVFIGETKELPQIFIEASGIGSYFSDGIRWKFNQICYENNKFTDVDLKLFVEGSDIDAFLFLGKDEYPSEYEEDIKLFTQRFYSTGLTANSGLGYETPVFGQNQNLQYVVGLQKYATFTHEEASNWYNNNKNGEILKGVRYEIFNTFENKDTNGSANIQAQTGNTQAQGDWKEAYANYLQQLDLSYYSDYALIYVDGDNIPELYLYGSSEASGQRVATYYNGRVNEVQLDRLGFSYAEKGNVLLNSDGNMGHYYDIFYKIENGVFVETGAGTNGDATDAAGNIIMDSNGDIIQEYTWMEQKVTEEVYNQKFQETSEHKTLKGVELTYHTSGDIISYLYGKEVVANLEYILPSSNSTYLSFSDISGLTKEELRYARNEIYARHGYIFKDDQLNAYFKSKSWYTPISNETLQDSAFNEYELANRALIMSAE